MKRAGKYMVIGWRSVLLSLLFTVLAALSAAASPIDRLIEIAIGNAAWRPVSGDIVVVGIDDKTLQSITNENMTVPLHTAVIEKLNQSGARRLFIDFSYEGRIDDPSFDALASAVRKMGSRAVLAIPARSYSGDDAQIDNWPSAKFGTEARQACICWEYRFWQVWDIPVAVRANGKLIPTFASSLANRPLSEPARATIDYSYDTDSIQSFSAHDLLTGKLTPQVFKNKDVIFAMLGSSSSDRHYLPGHDLVPGAYIHLVAGETLKRGTPVDLGWLPPLLVVVTFIGGLLATRTMKKYLLVSACLAALLIVTKILLVQYLVRLEIAPAILFVAIIAFIVARVRHRQTIQHHNPISGLPNFSALRAMAPFQDQIVIAAQIVNFEELVTYLPAESSTALVEQVARRLEFATTDSRLYHDADGCFSWLSPLHQKANLEGQLAGLAALFNAPLIIDNRRIDVNIAFGINDENEGSNAQRLAAAKGAADRAVGNRSLLERYSGTESGEAAWKLSFHSQLEDALTAGDIWVAFQPQFDIKSARLIGIEALARWTHPERGIIPPDQFIVQAEKSQDIYRLTLFVMDRSIQAGAELHAQGHPLSISVNLSAGLLDRSDLASTINVMMLAHRLPLSCLTIEITETAQFEDSPQALQTLADLRQCGIRLSIDDYGTGQSNLEYLIRIDADEIKIDKRFVQTMRESQRNFEIVKSTIDLAHRLGAVAVAEGIEDQATLNLLSKLGCDVGQGYHLGKPQLFFEILASLNETPSSRTA